MGYWLKFTADKNLEICHYLKRDALEDKIQVAGLNLILKGLYELLCCFIASLFGKEFLLFSFFFFNIDKISVNH